MLERSSSHSLKSSSKKTKHLSSSLSYSYALKSFLGYLEGTEKASHTISSYKSDLTTFQTFLKKGMGRSVPLTRMTLKDLGLYHEFLKKQGLKTNTRRRKLLTVRRFLRYLNQRNKLAGDFSDKIPAPYKVERIPKTFPMKTLLARIYALPKDTLFHTRNRLLLWTLAESGCLVSEISKIQYGDFSKVRKSGFLSLSGKNPRDVAISPDLVEEAKSLKKRSGASDSDWVFLGYNKFGPLGGAISPRGVELLVRAYSKTLGFSELTPRSFRHSVVVHWYVEGESKDEIQKRLGLKTPYAFRVYDPLFKKKTKSKK